VSSRMAVKIFKGRITQGNGHYYLWLYFRPDDETTYYRVRVPKVFAQLVRKGQPAKLSWPPFLIGEGAFLGKTK